MTDNQNKSIESQKMFPEKLQSKGVDINKTPDNNMNALYWASNSKKFNDVKLLLEHGTDTNSLDKYRETSLDLALEKGSSKVVEILFDNMIKHHGHNKALPISKLIDFAYQHNSSKIINSILENKNIELDKNLINSILDHNISNILNPTLNGISIDLSNKEFNKLLQQDKVV